MSKLQPIAAGVDLSLTAEGGHGVPPVSGPPSYSWANAVSGYFFDGANWAGGVAPSDGSDVILPADGAAPYTVTITSGSFITLDTMQIAANATLAMLGPKGSVNETFLNLDNGGANAGLITTSGGVNLEIAGTFANSGEIKLTGTKRFGGYLAVQQFASALTLSGGGKVLLRNGGISGLSNSSTQFLTNVDNTISGSGRIQHFGGQQLILDNQAMGIIAATGNLFINSDSTTINAGIFEATGKGVLSVFDGLTNTGQILAKGAAVFIRGDVDGAGKEIISGSGYLDIASSFGAGANQAVSFATGAAGVFKIDQAENFTGTLRGLATGDFLDLGDINVATASLTYTGTTTSGTLTVTDGTTTATIALIGNYTQGNFAPLANDGGGHTDVRYNGTGMASILPPHPIVAAMASLGAASAAAARWTAEPHAPASSMLAAPRTMIA